MGGADRVAMAPLAVDLGAGVLSDGVVDSQLDGLPLGTKRASTVWASRRASAQEDQRSWEKKR